MEAAIERLAAVSFFIIGLSHIMQPRAWAQFFIDIREKGDTGSFINAFIHFPLGALIVAFHPVWRGLPLILTLIGYGLAIKGLIYFLLPRYGRKMLARVSLEKSGEFVLAGVIHLGLSGLLLYILLGKQI